MGQFWVIGVLAGIGSVLCRREGLLGTNILGSTTPRPMDGVTVGPPLVSSGGTSKYMTNVISIIFWVPNFAPKNRTKNN